MHDGAASKASKGANWRARINSVEVVKLNNLLSVRYLVSEESDDAATEDGFDAASPEQSVIDEGAEDVCGCGAVDVRDSVLLRSSRLCGATARGCGQQKVAVGWLVVI